MHPFPAPLAVPPGPSDAGRQSAPRWASVAGPVTYQRAAQAVFAGESLAQALRQLLVYGRDGLPVLSADGRQVQGWVTNSRVLQTIARQIHTSQAQATQAQFAADWALPDPEAALREPPTPLPGYQMLEISVEDMLPRRRHNPGRHRLAAGLYTSRNTARPRHA